MKRKTNELIGAALDWAVAHIEEASIGMGYYTGMVARGTYSPSTDWTLGGPIIEQEGIQLHVDELRTEWLGSCWGYPSCQYGPTPLIAAMRCYVASKLGDEVEVPDEIC